MYLPPVLSGNMISISSFFAPFFTLRRRAIIHWCSGEKSPSSFSTPPPWSSSISRRRRTSSSWFLRSRIHHSRPRRSSSCANGCNLTESLHTCCLGKTLLERVYPGLHPRVHPRIHPRLHPRLRPSPSTPVLAKHYWRDSITDSILDSIPPYPYLYWQNIIG